MFVELYIDTVTADETLLLAATVLLLLDEDDKPKLEKRKRLHWVLPWIAREERRMYHQLFQELSLEDTPSFREFMRMDRDHFQSLAVTLYRRLMKNDTVIRDSIKPEEICITIFGHWGIISFLAISI